MLVTSYACVAVATSLALGYPVTAQGASRVMDRVGLRIAWFPNVGYLGQFGEHMLTTSFTARDPSETFNGTRRSLFRISGTDEDKCVDYLGRPLPGGRNTGGRVVTAVLLSGTRMATTSM